MYVGAGVNIGPGARVKEAIVLDRAEIQVSEQVLSNEASDHVLNLCANDSWEGRDLCKFIPRLHLITQSY